MNKFYLRKWAAIASAGAVAAALLVAVAPAQAEPDGPVYNATITRTEHDIPHIVAEDWGSLGFGSGYAAAETSICTLVDTVLAARGERSKYLGPEATYNDQVSLDGTNLQVDALVADIRARGVVEELYTDPDRGPSDRAKQMVAGYAEGVNQWLRDVGGVEGITDPKCDASTGYAEFIQPNATEMDLWYGVYLANMLASTGFMLKEILEADVPTVTDPGLPTVISDLIPLAKFATVPDIPLDLTALPQGLGIGSNATALGKDVTTTGSGMLLGNPHFPWRGRYRFTQQHLTIPGEYDVAGGSLIGSPAVNIGFNDNVAWSHTVSTGYRFVPYEYKIIPGLPTKYLTANGLVKDLDHRVVQVEARQPDGSIETLEEDMYRTPQGYVIDAPALFMGWTPISVFAIRDTNAEHLRTIDSFLDIGGADSVDDLLAKQDASAGIPWVNTIAADRDGNVLYADHSVVPHVTDAQATLCMSPIGRVLQQVAGLPALDGTLADSLCALGTDAGTRPGIFGPENLPDVKRTDWVMNANDSYWLPNPDAKLEGYSRIIGCEKCVRTLRSRMVYRYVMDAIEGGNKISPEQFRGFQHENRVMFGEVAGDEILDVCRAADYIPDSVHCRNLAKWDGTSNKDAIGYSLVQEFAKRVPGPALLGLGPNPTWQVAFDADDPVNTPRDLNATHSGVLQAMRDALDVQRAHKIKLDDTWGEQQVAADDHAPPIPLGGGDGDMAGNANALMSRGPTIHTNKIAPITYGSSHIQAIAFLPDGGLDAKTILTYGQSENPNRPSHADQTEMFSNQEWVSFPWTDAEIEAAKVAEYQVSNVEEEPGEEEPGEDDVMCQGQVATIVGTDGDDEIVGTEGDDVIAAGPGDDRIWGMGGNDVICGGEGNDTLMFNRSPNPVSIDLLLGAATGEGNVTFTGIENTYGSPHDDIIRGNGQDNRIYGQGGNDLIWGGGGNDTINGGPGNDVIFAGGGNDVVRGGMGDDLVYGGPGNDVLRGEGGDDSLSGGGGNDIIWGGAGNDLAYGGPGDDRLNGEGGSDRLYGGQGNNRIDGGPGSDVCAQGTLIRCEG